MNTDQRRALALGALATLLYFCTAPAVPNPDGLGYLKLLPHNFAAGHLLFMPLLRGATRLVHGDGLGAGRLLDALLGGSGVVLMYGITRRALSLLPLGRPYSPEDVRFAATLAASGLALSYGYWVQSSDLEAYAAATVALLSTVRLALAYRADPSPWRALAAGALLGVSVLLHLSHVLLAPLVAAAIATAAPSRTDETRPRNGTGRPSGVFHAALALLVGGALSLGAYAYAALVVRGHDVAGALEWIASASHGFAQGGGAYRAADAVYGLAKSVVWSPYLYEADQQKLVGQLLLGLVPLTLLAVLLISRRRALPPLPWRLGLVWLVPYTIAGVLFFGSDSERWLFVLPALWLAAAAMVSLLPRRAAIAVTLCAYLFAFNFFTAVLPAHRDERVRLKARAAAARLSAGDLVVFPGHAWDEYVGYYSDRPLEPFPIVYYVARDGIESCFARLARDRERVIAQGGHAVALRVFDDDDGDARGWDELAALGLSRGALRERLRAASIPPAPRDTTQP